MDASNMLKPALSRGELQAVGATTLDEYQKHIEKDSPLWNAVLRRYLLKNRAKTTPSVMLMGLRDRYEAHHKVSFSDEALVAAVKFSSRYLPDRRLPDKAIDLMDEAAAKLRVALFSLPPELKTAQTGE